MKKVIITLLCLAIISGGGYFGYKKYQQNKDDKRIVDVISVSQINEDYYMDNDQTTEAVVTSGSIQNVELDGQNMVKKVCVKAGDKVKKGDTLLIYDTTVLELQNEQRKNQIAVIEQEIKEADRKLKRLQSLQPSELAPKESEADNEDSSEEEESSEETTTTTTTKPKTTTTTTTTTSFIAPVSTSSQTDTEEPEEPEEPMYPDDPEPEPEPVDDSSEEESSAAETEPEPEIRTVLDSIARADGVEEDSGAFIYNCYASTEIKANFMKEIKESKTHAVLYVYNEDKEIIYMWELDGANDEKLEEYDWKAGDGVINKRNTYAYDGSAQGKCGMFFVYIPPEESEDESYDDGGDENWDEDDDYGDDWGDDWEDEGGDDGWDDGDDGYEEPEESEPDSSSEEEEPEDTDSDLDDEGEDFEDDSEDDSFLDDDDDFTDDSEDDGFDDLDDSEDENGDDFADDNDSEDPNDENYMYTRAELAEKIKEQQVELKDLELNLKSAQLEYDHGLKRKEDGKVVAKIDGVVTRVGDETSAYVPEGEEGFEGDMDEEGMDEEGEDFDDESLPFIIIQGKAGVSLDISVSEMQLYKFPVGAEVTGIAYDTGESFTAVITGLKEEPASYQSYGTNPNSSVFLVTADVKDNPALVVDHYVSVNIPADENQKQTADLIIPLCYLHKEGSVYYAMKADEDGLLKKQYVKTGRIVWGSSIEVMKGLSADDMICFPYGNDVKEGVKTRETDEAIW